MILRRISLVLVTICVLALLVACGGTQAGSTTQPQVATEAPAAPTTAPAVEPTTAVAPTESLPEATEAPMPEATMAPEAEATEAPMTEATTTATEATTTAGSETTGSGAMRTFVIVPDQTTASYEVQEKFANRDLPNKAKGTTNAVEGEFQFSTDGQPTLEVTRMRVDLRTLTSDSDRRDGRIRQQWLESDTYPYADFVSTGVEGAPATYTEGEEVSFRLNGDLTIREITKPVTFDVTGKLEGDTVTGVATTQVMMVDFGFEPPNILNMLTVEDGVTIMIEFTAQEGAAE